MKNKPKLHARVFLITALIIVVFTVSEIIYGIRNPFYATQFSNRAANYFSGKDSLNGVIFFLDLTTLVHTYITGTRFPGKIRSPINPKNLKDIDKSTEDELLQLTKDRIGNINKENSVQALANYYYHFGLILHEKGYKESARKFFKTAINLNPEMSFLFLELADSYFETGQKADGLSTLSYCLEFEPPKEHCRRFLKEYFEEKTIYRVGYFSDLIDEFHSKK